MSKKVISHNQSGGITGYNVDVKGSNIDSSHKGKKRDSWYWNKISKSSYVLVTIITILTYLGIKPQEKQMSNEEDKKINVTSHNQSGGITAYRVNMEHRQRTLTPELKSQLEELVTEDKGQPIEITTTLGDQESIQFATEIKSYLESEGWKVGAFLQVVPTKPIIGLTINTEGDKIRVGSPM